MGTHIGNRPAGNAGKGNRSLVDYVNNKYYDKNGDPIYRRYATWYAAAYSYPEQFDYDGYIKYNLSSVTSYSEDLDLQASPTYDARWIQTGNTDPYGFSVQKFEENGTAAVQHAWRIRNPYGFGNGNYAHLKQAGRSNVLIRNTNSGTADVYVDLLNGTATTSDSAIRDLEIKPLLDDWYSVYFISTTADDYYMRLANSSGSITYDGDNTSGIYISAFMSVPGYKEKLIKNPDAPIDTVGDLYFPSSDGADGVLTKADTRFCYEYENGEWVNKGVLTEKPGGLLTTRTNLVPFSDELSNVRWTTTNGDSISDDTQRDLSNALGNVYYFTANADSSAGGLVQSLPTVLTGDTVYCASAIVKNSNTSFITIYVDDTSERYQAWFDLQSNVVGSNTGNTIFAHSMKEIAPDTYQCYFTFTSNATPSTSTFGIQLANADLVSTSSNGESFISYYAAVEPHTVPTSPIRSASAATSYYFDRLYTTTNVLVQTSNARSVVIEAEIDWHPLGKREEHCLTRLFRSGQGEETIWLHSANADTGYITLNTWHASSAVYANVEPFGNVAYGQSVRLKYGYRFVDDGELQLALNGNVSPITTGGRVYHVYNEHYPFGLLTSTINNPIRIKALSYMMIDEDIGEDALREATKL